MRSWTKAVVAATSFCAISAFHIFPAQAGAATHWLSEWASHGGSSGGSNGGNSGGSGGGSVGVPGPIAGAGVPFLLIAGGYVLLRRYRSRNRPG
jgi:hypothetical protein